MSDVVTTLIIILLVIAAIGIIWVVVKAFLQSGAEQISLDKFTLDLDIKNAYVNQQNGNITVIVGRGTGEGSLAGMKFIVANEVLMSESFESMVSLGTYDTTTLEFHLENLSPDEVRTVSVAPIYENSAGKKIFGELADTFTIPIGGGNPINGEEEEIPSQPQCTPDTCESLGFNCGGPYEDGCGGEIASCGSECEEGFYCNAGVCVSQEECQGNTCETLGKECGIWEICGVSTNCTEQVGGCGEGICNATGQCCLDSCSSLGYDCGMWNICGILTNCTEQIGCSAGEVCNSTDGTCFTPTPEVVNATLINLWPSGLNIFLDSEEFPKGISVGYTNYYLKADPNSGAQDANCYLISTYQTPYNETLYNRTYLKLSAYFTNLKSGDKVNIWKQADWCLAG